MHSLIRRGVNEFLGTHVWLLWPKATSTNLRSIMINCFVLFGTFIRFSPLTIHQINHIQQISFENFSVVCPPMKVFISRILCYIMQITMSIAREVASVTRLGIEVCLS